MGNLGFPEMFVIGVLALLVFGPERLPELARTTAKFINRFRTEAAKSIADLKEAADLADLETEVKAIRGELTGARDEITRSLTDQMDAVRDVGKPVSPGGPSGDVSQAADGRPPVDLEAT